MEISVIVPVYNVAEYLECCMDSLLAQKLTDLEIILVDDGSTDGSGELCDAYAAFSRVRVVHQVNAGLGLARNRGLKIARGSYVTFVDSDDYVGPDFLEKLHQAAMEEDADLVIGGYAKVFQEGGESAVPWTTERRIFAEADRKDLILNTVGALPEYPADTKYGVSVWARLYRRSLLAEHGIAFVSERELISEDLIFNLDVLRHVKKAVVLPDTSYFYRIRQGTLSKSHRPDRFERDYVLYRAVVKKLERDYEPGDYGLFAQRMLISRARFDIAQEVDYHDRADGRYSLKQAVKNIAEHPGLQRALAQYPWKRLPKMQGVFALMMKKRQIGTLILLVRLRRRFLPEEGRRKKR